MSRLTHGFFKAKGHYDILDIKRNASEGEIRKAYLKKAKEFHPDKNDSP